MPLRRKDDWFKPRARWQHFTDAEIKRISDAFNESISARDLARELQCSTRVINTHYAAIRGTPHAHHVERRRPRLSDFVLSTVGEGAMASGRPWTAEEITQATALKAKQLSSSEIGRRIGRTADQVRALFKRMRDGMIDPEFPRGILPHRVRHGDPTPAEVLFDRDRRMNLPDTPNTCILGDPKTPRWNSNADAR